MDLFLKNVRKLEQGFVMGVLYGQKELLPLLPKKGLTFSGYKSIVVLEDLMEIQS